MNRIVALLLGFVTVVCTFGSPLARASKTNSHSLMAAVSELIALDAEGSTSASEKRPASEQVPGDAEPSGAGQTGEEAAVADLRRQRLSQGAVDLTVQVDPVKARIVEPITIRLQVDAPAGTTVTFPAWDDLLGEFSILDTDVTRGLPLTDDGSRRRWLVRVRMEALQVGEKQIPALRIPFRLPDDSESAAGQREGELRTEPIPIRITSVLESQADPRQFRDIKGAAEVPLTGTRRTMIYSIGGAALLLAAAATAWWAGRRRRPDPKAWALAEVERIESIGRQESMQPTDIYSQLDSVLREYLEEELSVPATSQSSEELSRQLQQASYPETVTRRLEQFLGDADELKFSGRRELTETRAEPVFESIRAIIKGVNAVARATNRRET